MLWYAGDHGFQLQLSPELPETLSGQVPETVGTFLRNNALAQRDIDHWIVHPGGPQILDSVQQSLGLSDEAMRRSWSVFRQFGNMSSPTVFFILKDLLDSGAVGRALAMAFGPGLTIEMVLFEIGAR
jgi:predicted naringenin-chalcone synthase